MPRETTVETGYVVTRDDSGTMARVRRHNGRNYTLRPTPWIGKWAATPRQFDFGYTAEDGDRELLAASILSDAVGESFARAFYAEFATDFLVKDEHGRNPSGLFLPTERINAWAKVRGTIPQKQKPEDHGKVRVSLDLPRDIHERLRARAEQFGIGAYNLMRNILRDAVYPEGPADRDPDGDHA